MDLDFNFDKNGNFVILITQKGQPRTIFDAYTVNGEYGVMEHVNLFHPYAGRMEHTAFGKDEQAFRRHVTAALGEELEKMGGNGTNTTVNETTPSLLVIDIK